MADSVSAEPYKTTAVKRQAKASQAKNGSVFSEKKPSWVSNLAKTSESAGFSDQEGSYGKLRQSDWLKKNAIGAGMPNTGVGQTSLSSGLVRASGIGSQLASGAIQSTLNPEEIKRDLMVARQQARQARLESGASSGNEAVDSVKDSAEATVEVVKDQGLKILDLLASQFWVGFSIFSIASAVTVFGAILTIFSGITVASGTLLATIMYKYNGGKLTFPIALLPPRIGISTPTEIEGDANFIVVLVGSILAVLFAIAIFATIAVIIAEFDNLLPIPGI